MWIRTIFRSNQNFFRTDLAPQLVVRCRCWGRADRPARFIWGWLGNFFLLLKCLKEKREPRMNPTGDGALRKNATPVWIVGRLERHLATAASISDRSLFYLSGYNDVRKLVLDLIRIVISSGSGSVDAMWREKKSTDESNSLLLRKVNTCPIL